MNHTVHNRGRQSKPDKKQSQTNNHPADERDEARDYLEKTHQKTDNSSLNIVLAKHGHENISKPQPGRERRIAGHEQLRAPDNGVLRADRVPPNGEIKQVSDGAGKYSREYGDKHTRVL